MAAKIEVIAGPHDVGKSIPMATGTWVIGRDPGGAMQLLDPRISRHHIRITMDKDSGRYLVDDLGSESGTLLHGNLINGRVELQDGDQLVLGNTTLVFKRSPGVHAGPSHLDRHERDIDTFKRDGG